MATSCCSPIRIALAGIARASSAAWLGSSAQDLYATLAAVAPSPVVELNRAAAIGMAEGPAAGLAALDRMDATPLRTYHLFPAARADFLRRLGRSAEAAAEYREALKLVDNARERAFLAVRLAECDTATAD
jgi:RNA polymerase sigma-70 factor (ECF subfamily)